MAEIQFQAFLKTWFASSAGGGLLQQEQILIDRYLSKLFGYYLVQIGQTTESSLVHASRVRTKVVIDNCSSANSTEPQVVADLDFLPFKSDSLDVILMPHTLESVTDPYHLVRQVDSMLRAEGALVITGFNPLGCSLLRSRFGAFRQEFKRANKIKMHRVVDWLNLLGYEIVVAQHGPISCFNQRNGRAASVFWLWVERLEKWLEKMGIPLGNVYILVAKKREVTPTPIGLNWKLANWLPVRKGQTLATFSAEQPCNNKEK